MDLEETIEELDEGSWVMDRIDEPEIGCYTAVSLLTGERISIDPREYVESAIYILNGKEHQLWYRGRP